MEPVSPIMLLRDLSRDRSNWIDVRHYPDTVTLRRMIRLADFAAQNPTRWQVIRLKHDCPGMTQTRRQRGFWNGADCLLPLPGGIRTRSAADSASAQRLPAPLL